MAEWHYGTVRGTRDDKGTLTLVFDMQTQKSLHFDHEQRVLVPNPYAAKAWKPWTAEQQVTVPLPCAGGGLSAPARATRRAFADHARRGRTVTWGRTLSCRARRPASAHPSQQLRGRQLPDLMTPHPALSPRGGDDGEVPLIGTTGTIGNRSALGRHEPQSRCTGYDGRPFPQSGGCTVRSA